MNFEENENMTAAPEHQAEVQERTVPENRDGGQEAVSEKKETEGQAAAEEKKPAKRPQTRRPSQRRTGPRTSQAKEKTEESGEGHQGKEQETGESKPSQRSRSPRQPRQRTAKAGEKAQTAERAAAAPKEKAASAGRVKNGAKSQGGSRDREKNSGARHLPAIRGEEHSGRPASARAAKDGKGKLKIIPLGGLEQIGMNITAFEYEDTIIVVDCGLAFPTDDMLGIDLIIPDVSYLKQNIDKVKAFVITHGHEDHIGALPYILQQVNVPVYGTRLTIALIEHKLEERNMLKTTKRKVMKHGQSVTLGDFRVEFIKTNHSIQDASALAIFTPVGTVLHTGDFKIDYTPVFGDPIDLQRFAELGKKGVLALLADSTNAARPGFTMSERTVGKTFDTIFAEHTSKRIIVATFASNVDRVQQVVNTAYKYGRKVVVEGRSMVTIIDIASQLGYINIPEGTLIDIEKLRNYPPEATVLITTGSQGESMAALSRMAAGIHKKVSIMPGDVVVLSSNPIPGNEKAVSNVVNELSMKGAEVICQDTHVSGHACQEDLKLIYSLVHPKFAIPVHGEYHHRMAQKQLAEFMGVDKEKAVMVNSGDVVALDQDSCQVIDHVTAGAILVDGLGVGDVGNIVLRDRQNLAQNGIIVVVLTLEKRSNQLMAGPDIVSRGFVYVRESEDLLEEAHSIVSDAVESCMDRHVSDWGKIKNIIRDSLSDFLWKRMKRSPMILPIIMEI